MTIGIKSATLFVFLPKLIQQAMKADADAAIEAFGKNEQVKRVFWTLFVAMAGLVVARVVDQSDGAAGGGDDYGDGGMKGGDDLPPYLSSVGDP